MKAIVTVGISASGKSTWADEFKKENPSFQIICRDDIRKNILLLKNITYKNMWSVWKWKWEKEVTRLQEIMIDDAIKNNNDIIIADTNLNDDRRASFIRKLEALGFSTSEKFFPIELKTAVRRDLERKNPVGFEVIYTQWLKARPPVVQDENKPKAIIVDVDGTLAKMVGRTPFQWELVGTDECNTIVRDMVTGLAEKQNLDIIVMSGRDGVCYEETEKWLTRHNVDYKILLMRNTNDQRDDAIVKNELFSHFVNPYYNVVAVFDDRPKVCREWRAMGLNVIQCADPYIEF